MYSRWWVWGWPTETGEGDNNICGEDTTGGEWDQVIIIKREGKIPGAFSCPRGMLEFWIDPKSPYFKDFFSKNVHFIFYCASGWRSALSTLTAKKMGLINVSSLDGGFNEWLKADGPIQMLE